MHTLILGTGSTPPKGIPTAVDTSVKNIAPTGRISAELPCVKCGFVLRGLSVSGRCPECGETIRVTLGASVLTDPEYARRGLEDLGTSIKCSIPALLGLLAWAILGPFVSVLTLGACYLRVSSLERMRRGGALETPALRPILGAARLLAWASAVGGSLVTLCVLHDAIGRWGQWLPPRWAIALSWGWTAVIWAEAAIASSLLRRAATVLEVGWLGVAARISHWLVAGGIGAALVVLVAGAATGGTSPAMQVALLAGLVALSWIPLAIGGWMVGACLQQVAGVASELHWLASNLDAAAVIAEEPERRTGERRGEWPASSGTPADRPRSRTDDDPIPID